MIACDKAYLDIYSTPSPVIRAHLPGSRSSKGRDLWPSSSFWRICLEADKGHSDKVSFYVWFLSFFFFKCIMQTHERTQR